MLTAICCTDNDDSSRARAFGSVYASHLKKYTYISGLGSPASACCRRPLDPADASVWKQKLLFVEFLLRAAALKDLGFLAVRFVFIGAKVSDEKR